MVYISMQGKMCTSVSSSWNRIELHFANKLIISSVVKSSKFRGHGFQTGSISIISQFDSVVSAELYTFLLTKVSWNLVQIRVCYTQHIRMQRAALLVVFLFKRPFHVIARHRWSRRLKAVEKASCYGSHALTYARRSPVSLYFLRAILAVESRKFVA